MGRAAGGDRQLPASVRVSGLVRGARREWRSARRRRTATRRATRTVCSCAANTCTSPKDATARASTTSRASPTRASREGIITAPFSPLGQDTHIASQNATCIALPTNQPIDPLRNDGELMRVTNLEQPFHPIYSYAVITDAREGLILDRRDDTGRRRAAQQSSATRVDVEWRRRSRPVRGTSRSAATTRTSWRTRVS